MRHFRDCLADCDLHQMQFQGDRFTWERKEVKERLEWVFCNVDWKLQFENYRVVHGLRFKSDHRIVIVDNGVHGPVKCRRDRFSYHAARNLEAGFDDVVKES